MTQKMDIKLKKCTTPIFRASFPAVMKPKSYQGQEPKYSLVMLFDKKKSDLKDLKAAALNAAVEKWGKDKTKWPKNLKMPFRDGDEKADTKGYAGHTFVTASSKDRPGLIDRAKNQIIDESEFYAGCFARASLIAFAYDTAGNRGVSFALQNIQKSHDGEKFSGRKAAEEEFDEIEDNSNDPDSYETGSDSDEDADESEYDFG